jgi:hypothetical protein
VLDHSARHSSAAAPSLGAQLARDRLLHRVARLERVTAALAARVREQRRARQPVPDALRHSLSSFERELQTARRALRTHDDDCACALEDGRE